MRLIKLIVLVVIMSFGSGCATLGRAMRGYSEGYNQTMAAQNNRQSNISCNSDGLGNTTCTRW